MKFLDQVYSYQKTLAKKSRFFSSLMLVSGISLVATGPFLSYEVSKIECHEKGYSPSKVDENEMIILKNDWLRKEQEIANLEKTIQSKDEKINSLIDEANCEDVISVIQREKNELEAIKEDLQNEIEEIEKEKEDCRERLTKCQKQEESRNNDNKDCSVTEQERDRLIEEREKLIIQYRECNKELTDRSNTNECSKLEVSLENCKVRLAESTKVIAGLEENLKECDAFAKLSIGGAFYHNEPFTINKNEFVVSINTDDVGARYFFRHNGKDVTKNIKVNNKISFYSFKDNNQSYRIVFGRQGKNNVKFQLSAG